MNKNGPKKPIKLWVIDLEAGILEATEEERLSDRFDKKDEDDEEDEEDE